MKSGIAISTSGASPTATISSSATTASTTRRTITVASYTSSGRHCGLDLRVSVVVDPVVAVQWNMKGEGTADDGSAQGVRAIMSGATNLLLVIVTVGLAPRDEATH